MKLNATWTMSIPLMGHSKKGLWRAGARLWTIPMQSLANWGDAVEREHAHRL